MRDPTERPERTRRIDSRSRGDRSGLIGHQRRHEEGAERLRVLIAEDETLVAEGLAMQLAALGHEVIAFANHGGEVVDLVGQLAPDLLLLDIRMPGLDGREVCQQVMLEHPLPIVIVTGNSDRRMISEVEAAGATGFLLKPSDERRLDAAIIQARIRFQDRRRTYRDERTSSLPVAPAPASINLVPERSPSGPRSSQQRIRVFVLGAEALTTQALGAVLAAATKLEVVGISTERLTPQLLEAVRSADPEIVLLNHLSNAQQAPGLVAALRAELTTQKTIVLLSTVDDDILAGCIRAGAAGYLTTDHSPQELIDSIRRVHAGQTLFGEEVLVNMLRRAWHETHSPAHPAPNPLAPREREVLQALAAGKTTEQIAAEFGMTVHTARTHLKNILSKLQVHSKLEAVMYALREGLIPPPW